jgi:hypothetical protein
VGSNRRRSPYFLGIAGWRSSGYHLSLARPLSRSRAARWMGLFYRVIIGTVTRTPSSESGEYLYMPRGRRTADTSLLEAALIGFQQMRRNVEEKISDIRSQLGSGNGGPAAATSQPGRRPMSPAARRRIAAAQRKMWAAAKAKSTPSRPPSTKRTMSPAARKKIAAAQRKRWALVKAKKIG